MKKLFTLFMMSMFAAITSAFAADKTSTWTMNTADGIAEITIVKQGASDTGSDLELTKDGITVTSATGYFAGSGSNGIQIYSGGAMTVTAPESHVIKSVVLKYASKCYPFAEALPEGGSSTAKTTAETEVTFTATTPANAFTFTNEAAGQTKVKKLVITYAENAPAGWDGTVTTSMDNGVVTKLADLDNLKLTFPGAQSIAILGEEDCQYMTLQNEDGSELYGIWGPTMGSTYTIDGNTITLGGFMPMEGTTVAIPTGTTKLYIEDYSTLAIDGKDVYVPTIELAANIAAAPQPFMLTSVTNNEVAGSVVGVEASEQGVSYQFNVTATGKALSKGEGVPTLSLVEDASVDFGAANLVAYEAETAYIRFMTLQQPYFTQPGTYVLSIPEGTFVDAEGTPNAAATLKWVIIQGNEPGTFAITGSTNSGNEPGTEVEALSYMFEITAANAIKALHEGNITLTDADNNPVGGNATVMGYEGEEGATTVYARFTFDTEDHNLHTAGTYTLNIPAGMFADAEGNLSEAYTATWTVVAPETQTINIETVEVGTVTDTSYGSNDVYYTATVKFQKPEGAKYAYSEGLHMELNGENTGVPFQFGQYGMISLEDITDEDGIVTLVYKDPMIAATDDATYEGDIRPAGSYVGQTEIAFLDENQWEIEGVTAKFTGSIVLPNLNAVELGTPEFNVAVAAEAGVKITEGWVDANGIIMTLVDAKNITPDMQIKVVADLMANVPGYGAPDGEDGGFNMSQFEPVISGAEFTGDAMFGAATVAMPEFAQYVVEAGAGNAFQIVVKSIEVIGSTGIEASWVMDEESELVGCAFEVVEPTPSTEVVLGEPMFNVDAAIEEGIKIDEAFLASNGLKLTFPEAENVPADAKITVVADFYTMAPGFGAGALLSEEDDAFTMQGFQSVLEDVEFNGLVDEAGVPSVMFADFIQYIAEAGAGAYAINVKSIVITDENFTDLYGWYFDGEGEMIATAFEVTETFEVEATATVAQTAADQWGDQHYQVIVTVENSDNEVSAAGVAYAYTEGVIFYDESTWSEFTFNCEAQEGVEVVEEQDIVLTCTDSAVSQTTDAAFEGELRAEGTYPAYCVVVLVAEDGAEVGTARYNGELTLSKTVTGINAHFVVKNVDVKYNLSGQRVNNAKGIVIMNGKKVVLK